jgi:hypothetical protein
LQAKQAEWVSSTLKPGWCRRVIIDCPSQDEINVDVKTEPWLRETVLFLKVAAMIEKILASIGVILLWVAVPILIIYYSQENRDLTIRLEKALEFYPSKRKSLGVLSI